MPELKMLIKAMGCFLYVNLKVEQSVKTDHLIKITAQKTGSGAQ